MSYHKQEEFVGSHIDENGFISFTKQKQQKKRNKDDATYGIWGEEVEDNTFAGSKKLAKTTLAMNFRKGGEIQHDADTGIKVKEAFSKVQETEEVEDKNWLKSKKKAVRFNENNLKENQGLKQNLKASKLWGKSFQKEEEDDEDIDQDGNEEDKEEIQIEDNDSEDSNSQEQYEDADEESEDDDEGTGLGRKRNKKQLFFKSASKKKAKGILKKKKPITEKKEKIDDDDLNDINDLDSEDEQKESQPINKEKIKLNHEQLRKKRIFDFKKGREDDENTILVDQSIQLGLPINFGRQRKQVKLSEETVSSKQGGIGAKQDTPVDEESQKAAEQSKQYGKGFNMLLKMGYKVGKGMGKNEQGRSKPLEAVYKDNFKLHDNYGDMEKENKKMLKEQFGIDVEEELDEKERVLNEMVRGLRERIEREGEGETEEDTIELEKTYVKQGTQRFQNRYFAELENKSKQAKKVTVNFNEKVETQNLPSSQNAHRIIDMRGNQQVIYDQGNGGYSTFFESSKNSLRAENLMKGGVFGDMLVNLKNKKEKCQTNAMKLYSKIKMEEDKQVTLEYEMKQIVEQEQKNNKSAEQLVVLLKKMKSIQRGDNQIAQDPILLIDNFKEVFEESPEQFCLFNMEQILVKMIADTLSKEINSVPNQRRQSSAEELNLEKAKQEVWAIEAMEQLIESVLLFKQNQSLINYENELKDIRLTRETVLSASHSRLKQRYVQYVINKTFMPSIRNFFIKSFDPTLLKANYNLIDCLDIYRKVLQPNQMKDIMQTLVLPRLSDHLKKWAPYKNPKQNDNKESLIDPDVWLLPWIALIQPEMMKDLFKLVISKFSSALVRWEVEDSTMLSRLQPWKKIVIESQWNDLMLKQVVPKLQYSLDQIIINPSEQSDLNIIENVVKWCELLSDRDVCNILEDTLLVKLAEVLMEWLSSEEAETDQIKEWLGGWKVTFGKRIMGIESFSATFEQFMQKVNEIE